LPLLEYPNVAKLAARRMGCLFVTHALVKKALRKEIQVHLNLIAKLPICLFSTEEAPEARYKTKQWTFHAVCTVPSFSRCKGESIMAPFQCPKETARLEQSKYQSCETFAQRLKLRRADFGILATTWTWGSTTSAMSYTTAVLTTEDASAGLSL
jgi:hypothetical protein